MSGESMRKYTVLPAILALGAMPFAAAAQAPVTLAQKPATVTEVVDKIVAQEQAEMNAIRRYSP